MTLALHSLMRLTLALRRRALLSRPNRRLIPAARIPCVTLALLSSRGACAAHGVPLWLLPPLFTMSLPLPAPS